MRTANYEGSKRDFMVAIDGMHQCQTDENNNIFISEDGKDIVELISVDHDIFIWNKKHINEGKSLNNAGYHMVHTRRGTKLVHRLVAEAWLLDSTNYYNNYEVDHIDGNKENNHRLNLDIVSHKENMKRAWLNNQISRSYTYNCRYSRKTKTLSLPGKCRIHMEPAEYVAWRIDQKLPIKGWMNEYIIRAKAYLYGIDDFSL